MKSRSLATLNAIGCLALTILVVTQWLRERTHDEAFVKLKTELVTSKEQAATAVKNSVDLERDVAALKDSIEGMRIAAEDSARAAADRESLTNGLQAEVATSREQVKIWQDAIAGRDAKLLELTAHLNATRQRLDAAITKLNKANGQ